MSGEQGKAKTGAQRVAETRERARKAAGYDQAVAAREAMKASLDQTNAELNDARAQLRQFQAQQRQWVAEAQAIIAARTDEVSVLQQQIAQLRGKLAPLAQPAPRPNAPENIDFVRLRCPRCNGPVDAPRRKNAVHHGQQSFSG